MSVYSKTKFVSKSLILISFLAVLVSGGVFLVQKNKIGADTQTEQRKNYLIKMDGNIVEYIFASNMHSSEVLSVTFQKTAPDIQFWADKCEIVPNISNSGTGCYVLYNKRPWEDPSIRVEGGNFKPAWAFLKEIKSRAEQFGDTDSLNKIKTVSASYVADAFNRYLLPNFNFTPTSGTITISDQEFFDGLKSTGVDENDPYIEITNNNGAKTAKMKFSGTYPEAKSRSAWLFASEYVISSMILPYKNAGLDSSGYEDAIILARKNYLISINSESKGDLITFAYPQNLLLSQAGQKLFKYTIDTKSFPPPSGGYKTKIYVKPASMKDEAAHIAFGPFSQPEYSFSWNEAVASGYIDASGKKAEVTGPSYDLKFPQQYVVRIVTYDGTNEKNNLLTTIQTQTEESIGKQTIKDANAGSLLKISAVPSFAKQGQVVTATIEAHDPSRQIKKIVLYACNSDAETVRSSDSGTCTYEDIDALKGAYRTADLGGTNLVFDNNNDAKVTGNWDTSFSDIGNHTLMAKAFTAESGGYIDGSQTLVQIGITNSSAGTSSDSGFSSEASNLLAGQFNDKASDNPKGSKFREIGPLADRIINIFLEIIGALSVIAIIVGGIQYITSGGDQQKAEKGKKTVLYACIGIAIAVSIFFIEGAVINIYNQLVS